MSNFNLKIIACIAMFIDHIAYVFELNNVCDSEFFLVYIIMRIIGRIAFPIFCFLLVEVYYKTHNLKKYILRLFIFALISEVPYNLAFYNKLFCFDDQNVMFTLLIGLICIRILDYYKDKSNISYLFVVILIYFAEQIECDYGAMGVALIVLLYMAYDNVKMQITLSSLCIIFKAILDFYGRVKKNGNIASTYEKYTSVYHCSNVMISFLFFAEIFAIIGILLCQLYNKELGKRIKYLFYVFYPGHLLVLYFSHCYLLK